MAVGIEEMTPTEILRRPYHRVIVPEEGGSFTATIAEFPGCIAVGDTAVEAFSTLEDVAESWLLAVIANDQPVPEPTEEPEYSGKLVLRLPKSLHETTSKAAERDGVSLNQFIVTAVAVYVGAAQASKPPYIASHIYNVVQVTTHPSQNLIFTGDGHQLFAPGIAWSNSLTVADLRKDRTYARS